MDSVRRTQRLALLAPYVSVRPSGLPDMTRSFLPTQLLPTLGLQSFQTQIRGLQDLVKVNPVLQQLVTVPAIPPLLAGSPGTALTGAVRASTFMSGHLAWMEAFSASAFAFGQGIGQHLAAAAQQEAHEWATAERVVLDMHQRGWYILPLLMVSPWGLAGEIDSAFQVSPEEAESVVMRAIQHQEMLLADELKRGIEALNMPADITSSRVGIAQRGLHDACHKAHPDGVAGTMIAQAEGLYNTVTGLRQTFYSTHSGRIRQREQALSSVHAAMTAGMDILDLEFTTRHHALFEEQRSKTISERNAVEHGELGFEDRRSALWACSFLMLTVDYLRAVVAGGYTPAP